MSGLSALAVFCGAGMGALLRWVLGGWLNPIFLTISLGTVAANLIGALLGGWTAGRLRNTPPSLAGIARCLAGGALMAWGTLLIPGSNDGLILIGMPLLWPYAWLAFGTMCVSIGVAQRVARSRAANGVVADAG